MADPTISGSQPHENGGDQGLGHVGWTDGDSAMCSPNCPAPAPHAGWPEHTFVVPQAEAVHRWVCGFDNEDDDTFAMGREFAQELLKAIQRAAIESEATSALLREVLEALVVKQGGSLDSDVEPGTPARNYELADRLGIPQVFGLQPKDGTDG